MNYKTIGKILSQILLIEAAMMIPPLLISLADRSGAAANAFVATILLTSGIGALLGVLCRKTGKKFRAKEGLVCVGLAWIFMSALGALPLYLSGSAPTYIDSFFEIVSGFTTTGSTIMPSVEALPRGINYWRCFTHWVGGMGVLVFLLAIVPHGDNENSGFTLHLLRAESPGPEVGKLVPKMKQTASILYFMYIFLTVLCFLFLLAGGMSWFEALCHSFGTAGTGGFGVKNDSLGSYSPYLQNVCTVFMILFGVNFNCYFLLVCRQFKSLFKNEEIRFYFGVIAAAIAMIAINTTHLFESIGQAVHHAAFQVASIITTTGFCTVDFNLWPGFSKAVILFLMFCGACAGSTGGGIKCSRVLLLIKSAIRDLRLSMHPKKVQTIRLDGKSVSERTVSGVTMYLTIYCFIVIVSFLLVSLDGFSVESNFSAVMACFNNIGPGFDAVGPLSNFAGFSPFSKLILCFDMLAGRLEIYPIIILLMKRTWADSKRKA